MRVEQIPQPITEEIEAETDDEDRDPRCCGNPPLVEDKAAARCDHCAPLGQRRLRAETTVPASELMLALQCGGSDAFSGISANPLLGWVTREIIRYGGAANLAETDELIGADGNRHRTLGILTQR